MLAEADIHLANVAAGLVVAELGTATLTRPELASELDREATGSKG